MPRTRIDRFVRALRGPTGRRLYRLADTLIVGLCLPVYAVALPLLAGYQAAAVRLRTVSLGQRVSRWSRPDVRAELRVADLARLGDGLVGVHRRTWDVRYGGSAPPFPDAVTFRSVGEFWFGSSTLLRRRE